MAGTVLAHTGEHAGERATDWSPDQVQSGGTGTPATLTKALGWFSIGLGVAQFVAPHRVARLVGAPPTTKVMTLTQLMGAREIAHGVSILASRNPRPGVWSRVVGDALDIGALGAVMGSKDGDPKRAAGALMAVAGTTAADVYDGLKLRSAPSDVMAAEASEMRVRAAVTINRSASDIYRYWRDFENLPDVMTHLQSVEHLDDDTTRWTTRMPLGRTATWQAQVDEDVPDRLIRWSSLPGSTVMTSGEVRLVDAPRDRGTELHVLLSYHAPGGALTSALLKLFGDDPVQQVKDDLRRFKQVMETGQVVRSDGTPRGTDARLQPKQRPAMPIAD